MARINRINKKSLKKKNLNIIQQKSFYAYMYKKNICKIFSIRY